MVKKIIFGTVFVITLFVMIYIVCRIKEGQKQNTELEYRQLPNTYFLFDIPTPETVFALNWSPSNEITIQGVDFRNSDAPVYIGDVASGKIRALDIRENHASRCSVAISPSDKYIAFADALTPIDMARIKIIQLGQNTTSTEGDTLLSYDTSDIAWSHDGASIAFTTLKNDIFRIHTYNLLKEQTKIMFELSRRNIGLGHFCYNIAWSADDKKIAFVLWQEDDTHSLMQSDIYIYMLDNNRLVNVTNTPSSDEMSPSWSPTEDILLFTSTKTNSLPELSGELVLATGHGLCVMEIPKLYGIGSPTWSPDGTRIAFFAQGGIYYFDVSALENEFNLFRKKCNLTQ